MRIAQSSRIAVTVLTATGLAVGAALASQNSVADKLARLAWLQGPWKAVMDGDHLDEFWSAPHADSMIGMFRWVKKDKLWMSEMLSIVAEGDTLVLRLKHFDRAMVGWEEKDKALTLPLVKQTEVESVFETTDQSGEASEAVRLTYRKTGADTMDIVLETKKKDEKRRLEFHFSRIS